MNKNLINIQNTLFTFNCPAVEQDDFAPVIAPINYNFRMFKIVHADHRPQS